MDNAFTTYKGWRKQKRRTRGWQLCIQWKDGSTSWVDLKDVKESNPVKVAEYALEASISNEPEFSWWIPHVISTRTRILAKVKTCYVKRTHKFGIELPKTVEQELEIDCCTRATFWRNAIAKEMKTVGVAFDVLEKGEVAPVGYSKISYHLVFDVKMDFQQRPGSWRTDMLQISFSVSHTHLLSLARASTLHLRLLRSMTLTHLPPM